MKRKIPKKKVDHISDEEFHSTVVLASSEGVGGVNLKIITSSSTSMERSCYEM